MAAPPEMETSLPTNERLPLTSRRQPMTYREERDEMEMVEKIVKRVRKRGRDGGRERGTEGERERESEGDEIKRTHVIMFVSLCNF